MLRLDLDRTPLGHAQHVPVDLEVRPQPQPIGTRRHMREFDEHRLVLARRKSEIRIHGHPLPRDSRLECETARHDVTALPDGDIDAAVGGINPAARDQSARPWRERETAGP